MSDEVNQHFREWYKANFIQNNEFKILNLNMIKFLSKVGNFQVLMIHERIHPNQVFLHQKVDQNLLYWYQLRNVAQICAKKCYLHSLRGVLYSKLAIGSFMCWFDGKNVNFSVKIVIAFLMTFPHCGNEML